ncbi:hypothetical protein HNY73_015170 [Argiope bruennichi]|uniref:Uncharacterized protein n=1 Tax=Argiope bruennichi TaxID=94029 RepID=A0A8T0EVN0_ARGBR|nr:hypothetical protein HNY73_015170 [Argiope bruennichi]
MIFKIIKTWFNVKPISESPNHSSLVFLLQSNVSSTSPPISTFYLNNGCKQEIKDLRMNRMINSLYKTNAVRFGIQHFPISSTHTTHASNSQTTPRTHALPAPPTSTSETTAHTHSLPTPPTSTSETAARTHSLPTPPTSTSETTAHTHALPTPPTSTSEPQLTHVHYPSRQHQPQNHNSITGMP